MSDCEGDFSQSCILFLGMDAVQTRSLQLLDPRTKDALFVKVPVNAIRVKRPNMVAVRMDLELRLDLIIKVARKVGFCRIGQILGPEKKKNSQFNLLWGFDLGLEFSESLQYVMIVVTQQLITCDYIVLILSIKTFYNIFLIILNCNFKVKKNDL